MLIENDFELSIPIHISFTLYRFDYIDNIIISRVLKECKNWSTEENVYTVKLDSFKDALLGNARLKSEVSRLKTYNYTFTLESKPNSIFFIWSIIDKLPNLDWVTFNVSYDKEFTRIIRVEDKEMLNFYFKVKEGVFDLAKIFDRRSLDIINMKIIDYEIMPNNYLQRSPYFYMKASALFEILGQLEIDGELSTFEILDEISPKIEEDDPTFLVITDYTPY